MENKKIKALKSMLESCYTYDELSRDNRYLKLYKQELGVVLFDKVYDEYSKYLNENYCVVSNTHTDHEGLTYNSLRKKKNK